MQPPQFSDSLVERPAGSDDAGYGIASEDSAVMGSDGREGRGGHGIPLSAVDVTGFERRATAHASRSSTW